MDRIQFFTWFKFDLIYKICYIHIFYRWWNTKRGEYVGRICLELDQGIMYHGIIALSIMQIVRQRLIFAKNCCLDENFVKITTRFKCNAIRSVWKDKKESRPVLRITSITFRSSVSFSHSVAALLTFVSRNNCEIVSFSK